MAKIEFCDDLIKLPRAKIELNNGMNQLFWNWYHFKLVHVGIQHPLAME